MYCNSNNTLVVIPARGGSKRIPGKNIIEIFGQPMIYWPMMAIRKIFSKHNILVSTDSVEIKKLVENKGLSVPFMRPKNLADDFTGTMEVTKHALDWYEKNIAKVEFVLTIYPTAVLLKSEDILASMATMNNDPKLQSILSATTFPFPIQRAIFEDEYGYVKMFQPQNYKVRSQDLVEAFHDAGQFSLSSAQSIRKELLLTESNVKIQKINRNNVIDIDTLEDLEVAEEKLRIRFEKKFESNWKFEI